MKVLIVSHNCISSTSNMGKTLLSYFQKFSCEEIAQFYIHCEEPMDDTLCHNYYRFTDTDAVRSIFSLRSYGRIFGKQDIHTDRITARTDSGWVSSLYQYGERRTAIVYALRELLWKCSRWNTKQLRKWVEDFGPDVVFFASGDYGFTYDIARTIAEYGKKPLVVCCVDDFYLYNRNRDSLLGRVVHSLFLKTVHKTMARAGAIFTICESLQKVYEKLFQKECYVLHTSAPERDSPGNAPGSGIAYLGNLELQRDRQLVDIGRTLQTMNVPGIPKFLDVYSCERAPEILKTLTPENGIRFHGGVSAQKVLKVMQASLAVIHTESFAPRIREIVRYSVSTKIAESLMNGPCLIAYGPEGIASMDYLKENGAAYTITEPEALEQGLKEILTDARLREEIVARARKLARANHSAQAGPAQLRRRLEEICGERLEHEGSADQLCV